MTKVMILHWVPGAGGDWLQSLLLSHDQYQGVISHWILSPEGRTVPVLHDYFEHGFAHDTGRWYWRQWTSSDCARIHHLLPPNKIFILPTHDRSQVDFLRAQFPDALTVGMIYPENFWPVILKNWCMKVGFDDPDVMSTYDQPLHRKLRAKGLFGIFLLGEQLKFGHSIPGHVACEFDVCIDLETLYAGQNGPLQRLVDWDDRCETCYQTWLTRQSQLHRYRYSVCDSLATALGTNKLARIAVDLDLPLDGFDQQLIRHFCRARGMSGPVPVFATLAQANVFFQEHFNH